ncbi:MAG: AAA family ATPase [Dehalococcoidia bacterium]
MPITSLNIHNYKSLRDINLNIPPFMVLVGANAAGKSNLIDALHFISEVYRLGLEVAVARKGGYENICFRRSRRSKAPIRFEINARIPLRTQVMPRAGMLVVKHKFDIQAKGESISADFMIKDESLTLDYRRTARRSRASRQLALSEFDDVPDLPAQIQLLSVKRVDSLLKVETPDLYEYQQRLGREEPRDEYLARTFRNLERVASWGQTLESEETELSTVQISRLFLPLRIFPSMMSSTRVYQLSPGMCREPGVPTPNPELDRFGNNLPAMIEYIRRHYPETYSSIRNYLRQIIPSLDDVEVVYTHRKTITLSFKELEIKRSWPVEDVSDGTVQVLAILTALFDPRVDLVAIEEPENSVHPWIIRTLIEAAREASKQKQIILTTHSPVLIESVVPNELRIAYKRHGETTISPALSLDDAMNTVWESGEVSLFDYIDSGIVPEAVPGGFRDDEDIVRESG